MSKDEIIKGITTCLPKLGCHTIPAYKKWKRCPRSVLVCFYAQCVLHLAERSEKTSM